MLTWGMLASLTYVTNSALALSLAASFLDVMAKASDSLFTCKAGNFSVGQPGSVTCYFGPSIHSKDYHIEINHYPFDASDSDSGDAVLQCYRPGEELQCMTKAGFEFDHQIQADLALTIPVVQAQFAGRYTCQLIPPDGKEPEFCHLHEEDTVPGSKDEDICHSRGDLNLAVILSVFLSMIVVSCLILVAIMLRRRSTRRKIARWTRSTLRSKAQTQRGVNVDAEEEDAIRTPFIMPPIVPYPESEEESEPDDNEKKGLDGDEEDARQPYKIDICLNYEVDYTEDVKDKEKSRYSGDKFDKGRRPFKIVIKPFDENSDDGQPDQFLSPPPQWLYQRQPYRRAWSEIT